MAHSAAWDVAQEREEDAQQKLHAPACSGVPCAAPIWMCTSRFLHRRQNEGSGWLLPCGQGELRCLHELQDGALDERSALEEHQLPRR